MAASGAAYGPHPVLVAGPLGQAEWSQETSDAPGEEHPGEAEAQEASGQELAESLLDWTS